MGFQVYHMVSQPTSLTYVQDRVLYDDIHQRNWVMSVRKNPVKNQGCAIISINDFRIAMFACISAQ